MGLCDVLGMCSAATWACVMCLAQRPTSSSCQHAEAHNTPPCPCPVVDLQAELRRSLEIHELWTPEWEEAWDVQRELAMLYKRAWLEGGVLVTSMQYSRHKSRNASRVLVAFETSPGNQQYYAAEVDYYVQLRQPAAGGSSASSSASSVVMAVLRCFKCRDVTDPDLAELLLTAVDGDLTHNAQTALQGSLSSGASPCSTYAMHLTPAGGSLMMVGACCASPLCSTGPNVLRLPAPECYVAAATVSLLLSGCRCTCCVQCVGTQVGPNL